MKGKVNFGLVFFLIFMTAFLGCGGDGGSNGNGDNTNPEVNPNSEVNPNPTVNSAPTVEITSPTNNETFILGDMITFEGTAYDPEDGDLQGDALVWTSLIGQIGRGPLLTLDTLTEGQHTITLTATDSKRATGSSSVNITIQEMIAWYRDVDRDKYSDGNTWVSVERPSEEYYKETELTAISGDCNDNNFTIHPGAIDICEDGIDQDCDEVDFTCFVIKSGDLYGEGYIDDDLTPDIRIGFRVYGSQIELRHLSTECFSVGVTGKFNPITNYRFTIRESGEPLGWYYSYTITGSFTDETTCTGTVKAYGEGIGEWCEGTWEAKMYE